MDNEVVVRNVFFFFQVMEGVKEITRNGARFMDGQEKEFDSIVLATGYKSNVPTWLKVNNIYIICNIYKYIKF